MTQFIFIFILLLTGTVQAALPERSSGETIIKQFEEFNAALGGPSEIASEITIRAFYLKMRKRGQIPINSLFLGFSPAMAERFLKKVGVVFSAPSALYSLNMETPTSLLKNLATLRSDDHGVTFVGLDLTSIVNDKAAFRRWQYELARLMSDDSFRVNDNFYGLEKTYLMFFVAPQATTTPASRMEYAKYLEELGFFPEIIDRIGGFATFDPKCETWLGL